MIGRSGFVKSRRIIKRFGSANTHGGAVVTRNRDLAEVLADWRGDAAVLRRNGNAAAADILERCARESSQSAEEWLLWLSEGEAALRAGRSVSWIRSRFEQLKREGHAQQTARHTRIYRACAIQTKANIVGAAEAGRRAAMLLRKSA